MEIQAVKIRFSGITKYLILIIGAVIMGFPFLWMIAGSLMGNEQIYKYPPDLIPNPAVLLNFVKAFDYLSLRSFLNSFIFTAGVTCGLTAISLLSGFAFAKLRLRGKNILFMLYIASLMIPVQVIIIPQFVIVSKLGWVNTYLGLIIPFWANISVGTFFFRQFFMTVPKDLYDAGRIDGMHIPGIFFRVYMPLAKSSIAAFGIITALNAWNMFIWPLVVTSRDEMRVLTVVLASLTGERIAMPMGLILACSFLSMVPILLIYIFAQRSFVEGVATVGLKG